VDIGNGYGGDNGTLLVEILTTSTGNITANSYKNARIGNGMVEYGFQRRRFHRPSAIEIFHLDDCAYFVNFPDHNSNEIVQRLGKLGLPHCKLFQRTDGFLRYFQEQKFTEKWSRCEMFNFEYRARFNIFNGRSFVDQSQYLFFHGLSKTANQSCST
jgi:hypothetical protein